MIKNLFKIIRMFFGFIMLLFGIIALVVPLIPGFLLIPLGVFLIHPEWGRKLKEKWKLRREKREKPMVEESAAEE